MNIRFDGKTIVIIGGSTGIGKATVTQFAASGGKVVFTGIEDEKSISIGDYHKEGDPTPSYYQLDITIEEDVKTFAESVEKNFSGCDVLFNNAGILSNTDILHEIPTAEWRKIMAVNVEGMYFCSKYFLPQMIKKGQGAIVNTSSMSGLFADYNFSAYNTSKGAAANMTRNMAIDYAKYNIRVNAVAPGSVRTPMYKQFAEGVGGLEILDFGTSLAYPMGRNGQPEEIANAVVFLASDQASFITGVNLLVDGGITAHTGAPRDWDDVKAIYEKKQR